MRFLSLTILSPFGHPESSPIKENSGEIMTLRSKVSINRDEIYKVEVSKIVFDDQWAARAVRNIWTGSFAENTLISKCTQINLISPVITEKQTEQ